MLAAGRPAAYVDPFDRICHGLRGGEKTPPQLQTRKKHCLVYQMKPSPGA